MAFPDVDVKDFTAGTARTVKGFDLGSSKTALSHILVDTSGNALSAKTVKMTAVNKSFTAAGTTPSYTSGEWISNNATAGSVTKLEWTPGLGAGNIRRVRIRKSDQTVATPTIRLWLWDATFTVAVGNDASGAQPLQDTIGYVDVAVINAGSDDAVGWTNCDIPYSAASIFGLLQSQSSFTGATSEVWTIDLWEIPG